MTHEELAFVNQQLAGMLRSGLPIEGALKRLSEDMAKGPLREELRLLEADLRQGRPLSEAFGFIGVFLGPTLLAVSYRLVEEWSRVPKPIPAPATGSDTADPATP